ncbi:MAG TPA: Type 1 glutamine amidotransferase-like domain-containing protein [Gaiellaceae bacterium]|nr:Type 1 glutamine amidotransferase-like domain-containing protein [Gaiellaceae bacterium]
MKRLLLASYGVGALPELADGETRGLRLAFVPTAAGPEAESKEWIRADRRQLEELGCELSTLDLATAEANEVEEALDRVDGVFVGGGNSFLLLWHARRSGFAALVGERVADGLLYAGTSAGALVAGPDLAPAAKLDDRSEVPQLDSTVALQLVPFTVLPHDDYPEAQALHDEIEAAHPTSRFLRLPDGRAVLVRGEDVEVVDSPTPA